MSELLPSRQAAQIRSSLVDYLTTTFALSDDEAQRSLREFLSDTESGIFRGPYVRARIPFRAAEDGWRDSLGWYEGPTPYGHQAEAFRRLSSANLGEQPDGSVKTAPLPTLVVTGTGSGKTEAFLYPILDHVIRAQAAGDTGVKALILYPMNALANDQSRRLAELIRGHEALKGVRAAVYTGENGGRSRTRVTAEGLINDRGTIRSDPPDILLTNYKMLDQLLLRGADQPLLAAAATSLRYLVLDEFHTYDGAQGTDVAMLLRRLGLTLKRLRPAGATPTAGDGPLGDVTPVATSATLGDEGDPARMLEFAETVFGVPFPVDSVVRETRQSMRQWAQAAFAVGTPRGGRAYAADNALVDRIVSLRAEEDEVSSVVLAERVLSSLFEDGAEVDWAQIADDDLHATIASHPLVQAIATRAHDAVDVDELVDDLLPSGLGITETFASRRAARRVFVTRVLAALSHIRARLGRRALSIDLHLWIRELTRIDRAASPAARFHWADDGPMATPEEHTDDVPWFPAIYCRHCGRSGWGVQLAPVGDELATTDDDIRRDHASRDSRSRFRTLLHAPGEAETSHDGEPVPGLIWFDHAQRRLVRARPDDTDGAGTALPVLALTSGDADDDSRDDVCPACGRRDGIRFLGSAMATMLSVVVTTLFGDAGLDRAEKKALVFTDSVQDAAHRAGFIQSRAHVFALRNAIRQAVADHPTPLDEVANLLVQHAGDDADARYRLLPPDLVEREEFREFWRSPTLRGVPAAVLTRVKRRLQFDLAMEFGLQSRVGRTLELTGSLAASVAATEASLRTAGRRVLDENPADGIIGGMDPSASSDATVVRWVRGVLERMRERGAIEHEWFTRYIEEDGKRWSIWGGRRRGVGMPSFPPGRDAPGYPRVGPHAPSGDDARRTHLDVVSSSQSWYAIWARKVLGTTPADGVRLTAALLAELERAGLLRSHAVSGGTATAYLLPPSSIVVGPVSTEELDRGDVRLECDVCHNPVTGAVDAIRQLHDGPCTSARCPGRLVTARGGADYYRTLYDTGSMRRVVAREHTSLLDTKTRIDYEDGFKASASDPSAPNVLVATPTLEMGIDIGDLSTVMLAGLPRSVASYLQRVGRAGRLTGNALSIATVTGRGDQLPRIGDPLSIINGAVRPPATFIDAQEILRRQYFASILDRRASDADTVQKASEVLKTSEAGSFLGDAIVFAEANATEFLDAFLASFPGLGKDASTRLRDWAMPSGDPGSSGLAASVRDAVRRWNIELQIVTRRRAEVGESLPGLEAAAELDIESDAKDAFRAAQAADRMLRAQQTALTDGYWISALERFGLLPNYTLLDDSVRLDAALSWIDPDTSEWREDTYSYDRGAAVAIHELAPGSYFYAQGVEIPVDAVDLGPGGEAVEDWTFCPACGFAQRSSEGLLTRCPRCRSTGIGDAAQRMPAAELKAVSALARRDEAAIGDRSDDRRRTAFTVCVGADLDPSEIVRRWYDSGTGFGVTYARDLTIRWVNLGKRSASGPSRLVAGRELTGPLFRVCDVCGQLDSQAGGNNRRDHRPWCRRRDQTAEKTITLALMRTLVTQGIFLRLPPALTLGDGVVVPSLSAAVLLGLRESVGGDPDHLRIVPVSEPLGGDEGGTAEALLIHDTVPGGTGYLAELAEPDHLHNILLAAWTVLKSCPCQDEQRTACHRCLLPFAPGATNLSRASAEQALSKLLTVSPAGEPATKFDVTDDDPGVPLDESVIEQLFRKTFVDRARALGGRVKEIPGDWGNKVQVSFPGDNRIWMLRPQVSLGPTRPDFVLEQFGGGADPIAIYTDGKAYHAVVGCNRLEDDADKRQAARNLGYRVLAVTWADLTGDPLDASWFSKPWSQSVAATAQLPLSQLDKLTMDPITLLMEWMQRPDDEARRRDTISRILPIVLRQGAVFDSFGAESAIERAVRVFLDGLPAGGSPSTDWIVADGPLVSATRLGARGATDFALVLDDRDDALSSDGFDRAWRLWLHLSNLAGWRTDMSGVELTTLKRLRGNVRPESTTKASVQPTVPLPAEWEELVEYATDAERSAIERFARASVPVPAMGVEVRGIPVSFAWPDSRVAVALGLQEGESDDLTAEGWTLFDPDSDDLAAQIAAATGGA